MLSGEADEWFKRNELTADRIDPVLPVLQGLPFKSVLEIGCSNGQRMTVINALYGAQCSGVDPSMMAVMASEAGNPNVSIKHGSAVRLPYEPNTFDLVIFGFCLYLCDREDLFRIAAEADRVLRDGGHIIIHDFTTEKPHKNKYKHKDGVWSFKMNPAKMFTWNPAYQFVNRQGNDIAVYLLKKDLAAAWPEGPESGKL